MSEPKSKNIVWSASEVDAQNRRAVLGHSPATVWFTGLSGSGKSTLAKAVEVSLVKRGVRAFILDGDNVRHGLNTDLGFSPADRTENIRRVGEVCRLFYDAGLVVLTAFISPYKQDRCRVRSRHPSGGFIEVFVDCPVEVCERRDVKGLYRKARAGEIADFSGVSAPYEAPLEPELVVNTAESDLATCASEVLAHLEERSVITAV